MAIQTQGFQFQNLARYTPVDPTLVGVDFSKIGSGIADAMKIGGALQQYQMRKQAMEEEAATRETRIRQANTMADLAAAEAAARRLNVQEYEDAKRAAAAAEKARATAAIPTFGPEAAAKISAANLAAAQSTAALPLVDIETQLRKGKLLQELGVMPLETQARTLDVMRKIGAGERAIGQNLDAIQEQIGLQGAIQGLALGGLKLSSEQAKTANEEADTLLKRAQAAAALAGKPDNPLPFLKELNDAIDSIEKKVVSDKKGNATTLSRYEQMAGPIGEVRKEGILFKTDVERDPILDKRLQELNQLRQIRDAQMQRVMLGGRGGGAGVPAVGGLGVTGAQISQADLLSQLASQIAGAQPSAGGAAQPIQIPAGLTEAGVTVPTSGVTLAPGLGEVTAPAPAARVRLKDGKVEMITPAGAAPATAPSPATAPAAEGESLTQYLPEAASAATLLLSAKNSLNEYQLGRLADRLKAIPEIAQKLYPQAGQVLGQLGRLPLRAVPVASAINLGDLLIGRTLSEKGNRMRATQAIGATLATDTENMYRQERIAGLLDQINNVLSSETLSREEKLDRARALQSRIATIREEVENSIGTTRANPYGIPTAKNYGYQPPRSLITTSEPTKGRGVAALLSDIPDIVIR